MQWEEVDFNWSDYPPQIQGAIALAREQSRRLTRCSMPRCRKRPVAYGPLVPPALKCVEPPAHVRPKPYAVCRDHLDVSADVLGDALYGPDWRLYDVP